MKGIIFEKIKTIITSLNAKRIVAIITSVIISFLMFLTVESCKNTPEESQLPKEVRLTEGNIRNYLCLDGNFVDGVVNHSVILGYHVFSAEVDLDCQIYPLRVGEFRNVEVTVIVSSDSNTFEGSVKWNGEEYVRNYWHIKGEEENKKIEITFKVGSDGRFSKKYEFECSGIGGTLSGSAIFRITNVSGVFVPSN